jgi:hypothetical protein
MRPFRSESKETMSSKIESVTCESKDWGTAARAMGTDRELAVEPRTGDDPSAFGADIIASLGYLPQMINEGS